MEMVLPYACRDTEEDATDSISDAAPSEAPSPLLANWGAVNNVVYDLDMTVRLSNVPSKSAHVEKHRC